MASSHPSDWTALLSSIAASGGEVLTELLEEAHARVQGYDQDPSGSFRLPRGREGLTELVSILDGVLHGLQRAPRPPPLWLGMATGMFELAAGMFKSCAPDLCVAVAAVGCAALCIAGTMLHHHPIATDIDALLRSVIDAVGTLDRDDATTAAGIFTTKMLLVFRDACDLSASGAFADEAVVSPAALEGAATAVLRMRPIKFASAPRDVEAAFATATVELICALGRCLAFRPIHESISAAAALLSSDLASLCLSNALDRLMQLASLASGDSDLVRSAKPADATSDNGRDGVDELFERLFDLADSAIRRRTPSEDHREVVLGALDLRDVDDHEWNDDGTSLNCEELGGSTAQGHELPPPTPFSASALRLVAASRAVIRAVAAYAERSRAMWAPVAVAIMVGTARSVIAHDSREASTGSLRALLALLILDGLFEAGGLRAIAAFTLLAQPDSLHATGRCFLSVWHEALSLSLLGVIDMAGDAVRGAHLHATASGSVAASCHSDAAFDTLSTAVQLLGLGHRVAEASFSASPTRDESAVQDSQIVGCAIVVALTACAHSLERSSVAVWLVSSTLLRIFDCLNVDAAATALSNARGVPTLLRLCGVLLDQVVGTDLSTPNVSPLPRRAPPGLSTPRWLLPLCPWLRDTPENSARANAHPDFDDDYFADRHRTAAGTDAEPSASALSSPMSRHSAWGVGIGRGTMVALEGRARGGFELTLSRSALLAVTRLLYLQLGRCTPGADVHRAVLLCQLNAPQATHTAPRLAPRASTESTSSRGKALLRPSPPAATPFKSCGIFFGTHAPLGPLFRALALRPLRNRSLSVIEELTLTAERLEGASPAFETLSMTLTFPLPRELNAYRMGAAPDTSTNSWATIAVGLVAGAPIGVKASRSVTGARWLLELSQLTQAASAQHRTCLGGITLDLPWCLGVKDERAVVIDAEAQAAGVLVTATPTRSSLLASLNSLVHHGRAHVAAAFRHAVASLVSLLRIECDSSCALALLVSLTHTAALARKLMLLPPCVSASPAAGATAITRLAWLAECERHFAEQQNWLLGGADITTDGVSIVRAVVGALEQAAAASRLRNCTLALCCAVASCTDLLSALTLRNAKASASFQRSGGVRRVGALVGHLLADLRDMQHDECRDRGAVLVVDSFVRFISGELHPVVLAGETSSHSLHARSPLICPPIVRPEAAIVLFAILESAPEAAQASGLRGVLELLDPTRSVGSALPSTAGALEAAATRNAQAIAASSAGVLIAIVGLGESLSPVLAPLLLEVVSVLLPFAASPAFTRELARSVIARSASDPPRFAWAVFERLARAIHIERSPFPPWARLRGLVPQGHRLATVCASDVPEYLGPAPSNFFSFDSEMSGLRVMTQRADNVLACGLPQWPGSGRANSGPASVLSFSFHCWVCVRGDGHVIIQGHERPGSITDKLADSATRAAAIHLSRATSGASTPTALCVAPPLDCIGESPTLLYVTDDGGRSLSLNLVPMLRAGSPLSPAHVASGRRPEGFMLQFCVTHQRRGHETLEAPGALLLVDRWYAVGLTHEKPAASLIARGLSSFGVSFGGHSATAKLFLNGVCVGLGAVGYPNFGTNVVDAGPGAAPPSSPATPRAPVAQWLLPCSGANSEPTWEELQTTFRGTRDASSTLRSIAGGVQCVFGAGREGEVLMSREMRSIDVPLPVSASASPAARTLTVSVAVDVRVNVCTHLHGALSCVVLFDAALSPEAMSQLWILGPSAPTSFAGNLSPAREPSSALAPSDDAKTPSLRAKSVVSAVQDPTVAGHVLAAFDPSTRVHRPSGSGSESQLRALFSSLVPRVASAQHPAVAVPIILGAGPVGPAWADSVAAALGLDGESGLRKHQKVLPSDGGSLGTALYVEALPGTSVVRRRALRSATLPHVAALVAAFFMSAESVNSSATKDFPVDALIELLATLSTAGSGLLAAGSGESSEAGDTLALQLDLCGKDVSGLLILCASLRRLPPQGLSTRTIGALFQWVTRLPSSAIDCVIDLSASSSVDVVSASSSALLQHALRTGVRDIVKTAKMACVLQAEVLKVCLLDRQTWCAPGVQADVLLYHARALLAVAFSSSDARAVMRDGIGFAAFLDLLGCDYPVWRCAQRDDDETALSCYQQARVTLWSLLRFLVTADRNFSLSRRVDGAAPPWAVKGCVPVFAASELHAIFFDLSAGRVVARLRPPLLPQHGKKPPSPEWFCAVERTAVSAVVPSATCGWYDSRRALAFADAHTAETLRFLVDFLSLDFCGVRICEQMSSAQFSDHLRGRLGRVRFNLNDQFKILTRASPTGALSSAASPALLPRASNSEEYRAPPSFRLDGGAPLDAPPLPRIRLVSDAAFEGPEIGVAVDVDVGHAPADASPMMTSLLSPPIASFAMHALLSSPTAECNLPHAVAPERDGAVAYPEDAQSTSDAGSCRKDATTLEADALYAAALVARRVALDAALYGGSDLVLRLLSSPAAAVRSAALSATLHLLRVAKSAGVAIGCGFNFSTLATVTETRSEMPVIDGGVALSPGSFVYALASARTAPFSRLAHLPQSLPVMLRALRGNPFAEAVAPSSDDASHRLRVPSAVVAAFNSAASRVYFGANGGESLDQSLASSRSLQRLAGDDDEHDESEGESSAAGGSAALPTGTARSAAVRSGRPPRPPSQMASLVTRYGRRKAKSPTLPPSDHGAARQNLHPAEDESAAGHEHDAAIRSYRSASGGTEPNAAAIAALLEHPSVRELAGGLLEHVRMRAASVSGGTTRAESVISSVSAADPRSPAVVAAPPPVSARCLFTGSMSVAHVLAVCGQLGRSSVDESSPLLGADAVAAAVDAAETVRVVVQALERSPSDRSLLPIPAAFVIADASLVPLLLTVLGHPHLPVSHCGAILQALLSGLSSAEVASRVVRSCDEAPFQWILPALRLVCRCYSEAARSLESFKSDEDTDLKSPWEACGCSAVRVLAALHAADIRRPFGDIPSMAAPSRSVTTWSLAGFRGILASLLLLQAASTEAILPTHASERMVLPSRFRSLAASQLLCGVTLLLKLVDSMDSSSRAAASATPASSSTGTLPQSPRVVSSLQRALSSRSNPLTRQSSERGGFTVVPSTSAAPSTPARIAEECRRVLFPGGDAPFIGPVGNPTPATPRPQPQSHFFDPASFKATERLTPSQGVWLLGLLLADEAASFSRLSFCGADERPRCLHEAATAFWGAVALWLQLGVLSGVSASAALASATPVIVACEPHERVAGGCARLAVALTMRALLLCAAGHCAAPRDVDVVTLVSLLGEWTLWPASGPVLARTDSSSALLPPSPTGPSMQTPHPLQLLLATSLIGAITIATPRSSAHLNALWLASVLDAAAPRITQAGAAIAGRLVAVAVSLPLSDASTRAAVTDTDVPVHPAGPTASAVDALRLELVARLLGRTPATSLAGRLAAVMSCCETLLLHEPVYNRVVGRVQGLLCEQLPNTSILASSGTPAPESVVAAAAGGASKSSLASHERDVSRQHLQVSQQAAALVSSLACAHMVGLRSTEDATRKVLQVVEAEVLTRAAAAEHLAWTTLAFGLCVSGVSETSRGEMRAGIMKASTESARAADSLIANVTRPGAVLAPARCSLDVALVTDASFRRGRHADSALWEHRPSTSFMSVREDACCDARGFRWRLAWVPRAFPSAAVQGRRGAFSPHHWQSSRWMLDGTRDGAAIIAHYSSISGEVGSVAASPPKDYGLTDQSAGVTRRGSVHEAGPSISAERAAAAAAAARTLLGHRVALADDAEASDRRPRGSSVSSFFGGGDDDAEHVATALLQPGSRRASTSVAASDPRGSGIALPRIAATAEVVEGPLPLGVVGAATPGLGQGRGVAASAALSVIAQRACIAVNPMTTTSGRFAVLRDALVFVPTFADSAELERLGIAGLPPLPQGRGSASSIADETASVVSGTPDASSPTAQRRLLCAGLLRPAAAESLPLATLASMENRRFRLQHVALEFYLADGRSRLMAFDSREDRDVVAAAVLSLRPPQLAPYLPRARAARAAARELAGRWRLRLVSNLDYLLGLNRLAGRTYNDLSQYPILPWVISNYTSPTLDLNDPGNYRDLAYPIGAQTPERRRFLRQRYVDSSENFREREAEDLACDPNSSTAGGDIVNAPPWHFGSFYLAPATVAWYLIRLEPMQSYHLALMDGKFDRPDRQFHSVAGAYRSATTYESDIKELTPEFFLSPDFLRNAAHGTELGTRHAGEIVDDVVLPPWAATPEEFVRIHRAALESDVVSARLHLWVDLVFGHKQRGPHLPGGSHCAVAACNVYHNFMYEGGVNLRALHGTARHRLLQFVDSVGIVPPVLFGLSTTRSATLALRLGGDGGGGDDFASHARALAQHAAEHEHDVTTLEDAPENDPSADLNPANEPRMSALHVRAVAPPLFSRCIEWCGACCRVSGAVTREGGVVEEGSEAAPCVSGVIPWPQTFRTLPPTPPPPLPPAATSTPVTPAAVAPGRSPRLAGSGGSGGSKGARISLSSSRSFRRSRGSSVGGTGGGTRGRSGDDDGLLLSAELAPGTPRSGAQASAPTHAIGAESRVVIQPHSLAVLCIAQLPSSSGGAVAAGGDPGTALLLTVDASRELAVHVWGQSHGRHALLLDPRTPGGAATLRRIAFGRRGGDEGGEGASGSSGAAARPGAAGAAAAAAWQAVPIAAARHAGGVSDAGVAAAASAALPSAAARPATAAPALPPTHFHAGSAFAADVFADAPFNLWAPADTDAALPAPPIPSALPPLLRGSLFAPSPCGQFLLSGGHWDGTLAVTHLASGRLTQALLPAGSGARVVVTAVLVVPAPPPAAVLVGAASLMRTAERVNQPAQPCDAHPRPGPAGGRDGAAAVASPAGPRGAEVGVFPGVSGALSPEAVARHAKRVVAAAAAAAQGGGGGGRVIVGLADGSIRSFAWLGTPAEPLSPVAEAPLRFLSAPVTALACVPAADTLVAGSQDGTVLVFSARSLGVRFAIPPPAAASCGCEPRLRGPEREAAAPAAPRLGVGGRLLPPPRNGGPWPPYAAPCSVPLAHGVAWAGVSIARHVLVYRRAGSRLSSHSANGAEQCPPLRLPFTAQAFAWSLDGERILVGGTGPLVVVLEASSLTAVHYVGSNGGCACPATAAAAAAAPFSPGVNLSSPGGQLPPALSLGPAAAAPPSERTEVAAAGAGSSPAARPPLPASAPAPIASPPPLRPSTLAPPPVDPRLPLPNANLTPFSHHVTALAVTEHEQTLFVGLQSGELRVFSGREALLTARTLHDMGEELGF